LASAPARRVDWRDGAIAVNLSLARHERGASFLGLLESRPAGHSLPGPLYHDPTLFGVELEHLWHRDWVFAGHECELAAPGDFLTLTVGAFPIVVLRGEDGVIRALHNVCRHRGSVVCDAAHGTVRRRLVCPYHQWSYELDGRLAKARSMPDDLDREALGLAAASCAVVGGLVFVSAAAEPPDVDPLRELIAPYLQPFELASARVAHETTAIEQGNWKLVMENNRECFHCRTAHPELCVSFPDGTQHAGGGSAEERRAIAELVERCESAGLPSGFRAASDLQYRAMRLPLVGGTRSMTIDGTPAVRRRFGELPDFDIGDVLLYHFPSSWSHYLADHAVTFRVLPLGPAATELRTTWLVPGDAVEGRDYDVAALTAVWEATNRQDAALVERAQRGVSSPAYRPGPYSPVEEDGVIQFVDWYAGLMQRRLGERSAV
jgi:Rieske 2Fe-2S family protein